MNYLKIVIASAMIAIGSQTTIAQEQLKKEGNQLLQQGKEQAKAMGKEKAAELKEKGLNKVAEMKEKGEGKVSEIKENNQGKVAELKEKGQATLSGGVGNGKSAVEFDNTANLSGKALQTARTSFATEKATTSINKIQAMGSKITEGQAKIAAARERLAAVKSTLSAAGFAEKLAKIDAIESKLNNFKNSISSKMGIVTSAKEKLTQFGLTK